MSHYIFPVDWIFWTKAKHHESNKKHLSQVINNKLNLTKEDTKSNWDCSSNTEYFKQFDSGTYLEIISHEIYPALDEMFTEIDSLIKPQTSIVTDIWYNRYEKGQKHEVHGHPSSDISGIYLLDLNEENTTVFFSFGASVTKTVDPTYRTNKLQEGDIILFPSHLLHYVLPSLDTRTTIAFNINCEF
jgi:hypothetical protein